MRRAKFLLLQSKRLVVKLQVSHVNRNATPEAACVSSCRVTVLMAGTIRFQKIESKIADVVCGGQRDLS